MNGLDFAIVIALSIGAIYGLSHGAIRMFTSVLALVGGIYFASIYYPNAATLIAKQFGVAPTSASVIGYLVLFAALFFVIEMVGTMLTRTLSVVHLNWIDRLVGAGLGAAIASVATGMVVMLMAAVLPAEAQILRDSQLAPRLLLYNEELVRYIPGDVKQAYEQKRAEIIRGWIEKETRLADSPAASPQASPGR
ncbi:MAG TPA: CvpA family protein [Candidatus Binataceae bacterium]|nr:CvpA family protein [Candidatus Binataceae bacterium]